MGVNSKLIGRWKALFKLQQCSRCTSRFRFVILMMINEDVKLNGSYTRYKAWTGQVIWIKNVKKKDSWRKKYQENFTLDLDNRSKSVPSNDGQLTRPKDRQGERDAEERKTQVPKGVDYVLLSCREYIGKESGPKEQNQRSLFDKLSPRTDRSARSRVRTSPPSLFLFFLSLPFSLAIRQLIPTPLSSQSSAQTHL